MNTNAIILNLVGEILNLSTPQKIILISSKFNLMEELTSFKLCIIVDDESDLIQLETLLYLELNCEISFDIVLYKSSQWENLILDCASFATKILKTGVVLYEL